MLQYLVLRSMVYWRFMHSKDDAVVGTPFHPRDALCLLDQPGASFLFSVLAQRYLLLTRTLAVRTSYSYGWCSSRVCTVSYSMVQYFVFSYFRILVSLSPQKKRHTRGNDAQIRSHFFCVYDLWLVIYSSIFNMSFNYSAPFDIMVRNAWCLKPLLLLFVHTTITYNYWIR